MDTNAAYRFGRELEVEYWVQRKPVVLDFTTKVPRSNEISDSN